MALLNARVLDHYSDASASVTTLILMFLPLVMASGGNAGSQSSTLFIRMIALRTGEGGGSLFQQHRATIGREVIIAVALGVVLAVLDVLVALIWFDKSLSEAIVIGGTVVAVVVMGTSFGAVLPLILQRLKMDPAIMSNPLIASILDVMAVTIFFQFAIRLL